MFSTSGQKKNLFRFLETVFRSFCCSTMFPESNVQNCFRQAFFCILGNALDKILKRCHLKVFLTHKNIRRQQILPKTVVQKCFRDKIWLWKPALDKIRQAFLSFKCIRDTQKHFWTGNIVGNRLSKNVCFFWFFSHDHHHHDRQFQIGQDKTEITTNIR